MKNIFDFVVVVIFCFGFFACDKFIDVELINSRVTSSVVFSDDNTATSAMMGIYYEMSTNVINSGTESSIGRLAGLSADELFSYTESPDAFEFEVNEIRPENSNISNLWNALYKTIYDANAMIEGLNGSGRLSNSVKDQLLGEALFIRAFCNFYLVNFFGDVPLVISTDYTTNSLASRLSTSEVYKQIVNDLVSARSLMGDSYVTSDRVRANSFSASSLLAKVYLYLDDWENAEIEASRTIESSEYEIVEDFNSVFLKESKEAIWQIAPIDPLNSTDEALYYVVTGEPPRLVLREDFVGSFEVTDLRLLNWVGSVTDGEKQVYFPHKYKLQEAGLPTAEYSIVLRLSEQYLIRAEARANLNKLSDAVSDLDVVRDRAGLSLIGEMNPSIDQSSLLTLIAEERKIELFTEWGNRWFDLKRQNTAFNVLSVIKQDFTEEDMLYPIPQIERKRNPSLGDQNPGY